MKIFLIGGAGFLGNHLVPELLKQKHTLSVLTRSRESAKQLEADGVKTVVGDLLQLERFLPAIKPHDAVVNIAMPDIKPGKITGDQFNKLRKQTTSYFSAAIAIAEKAECPLIATLGTSFRTRGNEVADESWPIRRFGMAKIGEFADTLIANVIKRGSPPLIQMLPGEIYGPGGLFRNFMYNWMKQGKYKIIGSGNNYIPRIHVADCARAYVAVLNKMPVGERFIIADDGPCTQREFADFMADCMNISRPGSIPGFLVKIAMGEMIYNTVTMNCRVSNAKAKQVLNWILEYPSYQEGLPAAIKEIENLDT
jgi:nucleoside-diphosphate-sugar epimerase